MAPIVLHITGDDEADAVLSRDPLALLIGMVLNHMGRGAEAEEAWKALCAWIPGQ